MPTIKAEYTIDQHGRQHVLYAGLLDAAHELGLTGIETTLIQIPNAANGQQAICQAVVTLVDKDGVTRRFSGLADADPNNVNRMMASALVRMAETRAKARALRDAINLGELDIEGGDEPEPQRAHLPARPPQQTGPRTNGSAPRPAPNGVTGPKLDPATMRENARRALETDERELRANAVRVSPDVPHVPPAARDDDPFAGLDASGPPAEWPTVTPGEASPKPEGYAQAVTAAAQRDAGGPPATPKQIETVARMARAAGKPISTEGLTRSQASEIITRLVAEMDQARAN